MQPVRYNDLLFQPDMLSAQRDDGVMVRLTRQERGLLLMLVRQPKTLVTRAQLLAGLGDDAGTLGERNIDYLVNRLRNRLGDSARAPRFIATQYGEGYVWIAEPAQAEAVSALLLVGPVFGLATAERSAPLIDRLAALLATRLGRAETVLYRPGWRPDASRGDDIRYCLDASLHEDGEHVHLALVLRHAGTREPIRSFRLMLARGNEREQLDEIAATIVASIWSYNALPETETALPADRPAHLRLHDAALLLTADAVSWRENEARLQQALQLEPGSPRLAVMLALNRYARLIQALGEIYQDGQDRLDWPSVETEIETLALGALPQVRSDPIMVLAIAKVLHFINRGHLDLVEQLTQEAFIASSAFAAAFSMKGVIAASRGHIEDALALYDKAIELSEAGSQFHIYLLVLKVTALLADDRRAELDRVAAELFQRDPRTRGGLGLLLVSPRAAELPPHLQQMLDALPLDAGRRLLLHLYHVSARQFLGLGHRRNVLRGLATHLVRRHGPDVLPTLLADLLASVARP